MSNVYGADINIDAGFGGTPDVIDKITAKAGASDAIARIITAE